ncbi:TetR/AcrR family transcriptional regulator [Brevibacterium oceani]|uniref:TetR/AcrR family transcriptional regulator n=1 Tax=Brevibacterium oceani TaxID=358099 RepID=UPI0015E7BC42|nr:TetR family transcriptional regulator [Brevibacterium oceani]
MSTFQRARSEEQREIRRQAILETTAAMLSEMPLSQISLNELSRRVGLAKSNVLRYFESREAILLELLSLLARDFLTDVMQQLPDTLDKDEPPRARSEAVASALAASFATHSMLCELLSAQAGVLEHNVSSEAAARYKRGARDSVGGFATLLREMLPELSDQDAAEAASTIVVLVGAIWTHTHPADALREAYDADPSLEFLAAGFPGALERAIAVFLLGLIATHSTGA